MNDLWKACKHIGSFLIGDELGDGKSGECYIVFARQSAFHPPPPLLTIGIFKECLTLDALPLINAWFGHLVFIVFMCLGMEIICCCIFLYLYISRIQSLRVLSCCICLYLYISKIQLEQYCACCVETPGPSSHKMGCVSPKDLLPTLPRRLKGVLFRETFSQGFVTHFL